MRAKELIDVVESANKDPYAMQTYGEIITGLSAGGMVIGILFMLHARFLTNMKGDQNG